MMKANVTLLVVLCLMAGCKNETTHERAETAVQSLVDTRVELVKAQNDLYATLAALDGLKNVQGDPTAAYEKFKVGLASTDAGAKRAFRARHRDACQLCCVSAGLGG